jgi:MFS family permease
VVPPFLPVDRYGGRRNIYVSTLAVFAAGSLVVSLSHSFNALLIGRAVQACFVFIPKFVVQNFSVTPSAASFMHIPFVLATAIGSPVFGRMIDKYGAKKIVITGLVLLAAGFYLLSLTGSQKIIYYISGVLTGLGLSVLAGSSFRYIMLNNTSAEDRAHPRGC